jgi:hypothetical protein
MEHGRLDSIRDSNSITGTDSSPPPQKNLSKNIGSEKICEFGLKPRELKIGEKRVSTQRPVGTTGIFRSITYAINKVVFSCKFRNNSSKSSQMPYRVTSICCDYPPSANSRFPFITMSLITLLSLIYYL